MQKLAAFPSYTIAALFRAEMVMETIHLMSECKKSKLFSKSKICYIS